MLMRRAGLKGIGGRPKWCRPHPDLISTDLVDRQFRREGLDQLWVTDITEHHTREGKIYCAVVLDVCSRRVVGWSIDSSPTAALVTNALGMAIDGRRPPPGTIIHSDHGVQGGLNRSSQHLVITEVLDGAAAAAGGSGFATGDAIAGTADSIPARHVEREFWRLIAKGRRTEEAAVEVGVSVPVGSRWFRHAGGMAPLSLAEPTGRYLSFHEREELALLRAQRLGVRAIARELGRDPGTISRELRRNAATRGGKLEYRATVAQWKAQTTARGPKPAKLVANPRLKEYVQARLSGELERPDGTLAPGPESASIRPGARQVVVTPWLWGPSWASAGVDGGSGQQRTERRREPPGGRLLDFRRESVSAAEDVQLRGSRRKR